MTTLLPALPEALIVRRNAHGFSHSFTALQMDKYGRECAAVARAAALEDAAHLCDGEKWVMSATSKSVDYINAFNEGCADCESVIRRLK